MVIFDTNILIELYRGNQSVIENIKHLKTDTFQISTISVAEFVVGARDKEDLKRIEKQLNRYNIIPVNTEIDEIFLDLTKQFALSHRPDIPDTFIAATALYYHLPLYTLNKKHFQFIPGIELI